MILYLWPEVALSHTVVKKFRRIACLLSHQDAPLAVVWYTNAGVHHLPFVATDKPAEEKGIALSHSLSAGSAYTSF
jgi:hypothetical protein